jgi:hypothetical protein
MKYATFTFMGLKGSITKDGFVQWATLSCTVNALRGALKNAALLAQATL